MYEEADEETEDNLYVHHDVIVPNFPLSVAWLDMDPTRAPKTQITKLHGACSDGRKDVVRCCGVACGLRSSTGSSKRDDP